MPNFSQHYTIGEVAQAVGMSVHALRFYEREELLISTVIRDSAGKRQYTSTDIEWLHICVRLRATGTPIADLRHFAQLVRQGPGNEAERLEILHAQEERLSAQIAALEESRSIIAWKTKIYKASLQSGTASGLWDPSASRSA